VAGAPERLRLLAEDAEDLEVISAALQDAIGKIGDIAYDPRARQLTLAVNRFRWEAGRRTSERVRSALQLGGVLSVKARKLRRDAPDAVIELLELAFEAGEAPGGVIALRFAGGGDLRCEVECVDAILADVSAPWPARHAPNHQE
jgi:hypothetical protein